MKTCKLLSMVLLLSTAVNAQTIGDSLSTIKQLKPNGVLEKIKGGYTYEWYNDGTECDYVYYLDKQHVCVRMIICPFESAELNNFLKALECDPSAVKIADNKWILNKTKNTPLEITLKADYFKFYAFYIEPQINK